MLNLVFSYPGTFVDWLFVLSIFPHCAGVTVSLLGPWTRLSVLCVSSVCL